MGPRHPVAVYSKIKDDSSLQLIFHKRARYFWPFWREMTCNLRHPMGPRHPVANLLRQQYDR